MGLTLVIARVGLACVFLLAGGAKLADLAGSRRAVLDFGVPERLAGIAGWALPVGEIAVAVALVPAGSARFGALGALVLLAAFVAAIGNALARGRAPDCHCFGQLHSAPAGWPTLARNAGLFAIAGFVAIAGWDHGGDSATHWLGRLAAGWLVALGVGVLLVALIGFLGWFSLQLLAQNGRIFARLEAIEAAVDGGIDPAMLRDEPAAALGAGLGDGGLPVGTPAPAFELPSLDGERVSLQSMLAASESPLLLVFSASGCGPCQALMPELADWQSQHAGRLAIAVVASGDQQRNREKATQHGLRHVLLQSEREVSDAYQAGGTPMALVVGRNGLIESPTVGGAEAIRTLVAQATRPALAVRQVPASNGHRHDVDPSPPRPDASRVGQPAPELALRELDGDLIALTDLYADRTVAIFWNPGCGFCQRMLPDLRALEDDPPELAPQLLVITTGNPDAVRELKLRSRVLLDPDSEAMHAFAAGGTPMGVQIDHGRIASPVAAGADAVFALIHAGTQPAQPGKRNGNGSLR